MKKEDKKSDNIKIWEDYIKNPSDIYDKDLGTSLKKNRQYKFDLHGFGLDAANKKVREIINYCTQRKYKELLLITGKGLHSKSEENIYVSSDYSKLKYSVPEFLKNDKELSEKISSISLGDKHAGGEGVLIIKFKKL